MAIFRSFSVSRGVSSVSQAVMECKRRSTRQPKRCLAADGEVPSSNGSKRQAPGGPERPTSAEQDEAKEVIKEMKETALLPPQAQPDVKTIACAIALLRGEHFGSDRAAKAAFGVNMPSTSGRILEVKLLVITFIHHNILYGFSKFRSELLSYFFSYFRNIPRSQKYYKISSITNFY